MKVKDEEEVKRNWEQIKLKEGKTIGIKRGSKVFACNGKSHAPAGKGKTGWL